MERSGCSYDGNQPLLQRGQRSVLDLHRHARKRTKVAEVSSCANSSSRAALRSDARSGISDLVG
jgi:hypothetical protein